MEFVRPVYATLPIGFVGFDIVRSTDGQLYLLELNSSPRFDHVIDGNGQACVIEMYKKDPGPVPGAAGPLSRSTARHPADALRNSRLPDQFPV